MARINWARLFLSGIVWTVIFNVLWIAALVLYLDPEVTAAWTALGLQTGRLQTPMFAVLWLALTFVGGVVAIWLYAAIRPRYGPGPKTAAGAGLAFWLIGNLLPMIFLGLTGLFSIRFLTIDVLTNLVMIIAATFIGAWLYREDQS